MSSDVFSPDLSGLANDYEILSDLRQSQDSHTYLARHRRLNRDVTITVVRVTHGDPNALTHYASDARTLALMRQRNVVPVIEGRWLDEGEIFAIVRARVRGSTLAETIGEAGPLPPARVASTLEQTHSAIEWARYNGIMHRRVSADAIVLQQGSGRVLLELELSPRGPSGLPDSCDDARTIGRLAFEMLSGEADGDAATKRLADLRPDLSPPMVRATEALMRCNRSDGSRDTAALIALLGGKPGPAHPEPRDRRDDEPAVDVSAAPVHSSVVAVKRRFGFNARMASGAAAVGIVTVLSLGLLIRAGNKERRPPIPTPRSGTTAVAAGEVVPSLPAKRPAAASKKGTLASPPEKPKAQPESRPQSQPLSQEAPPRRTVALPESRAPEPRAAEADRVVPALNVPGQGTLIPTDTKPAASATPDSNASAPVVALDVCESVEPGHQQQCLTTSVARNDREMESTYARLIATLKQRGSPVLGAAEPASVDSARRAQQRWVQTRDSSCRAVGVGALYARSRAQCYANQATNRNTDLLAQLGAIPP